MTKRPWPYPAPLTYFPFSEGFSGKGGPEPPRGLRDAVLFPMGGSGS